jgi:ribosomal protein L7/L12
MNQSEEDNVDKRVVGLVFVWVVSLFSWPAIADSTGDTAKTDEKVTTKKAAGAAATVIGGKKAAAVKAIDRATGGQVTEGAKQGVDAAADTVKEGVNKVTGSSAGGAESKPD